MFDPRETDEVFLETASCFGANALLFGSDRNPTVFPHSSENRGSRKKAIPVRNTFDRLRSEDARSHPLQFLIRNCYCSTVFWEIISAETHDFMTGVVVSCLGSGVLLTPPVLVKRFTWLSWNRFSLFLWCPRRKQLRCSPPGVGTE